MKKVKENRNIIILTNSPLEHYGNIKVEKISSSIKPLSESVNNSVIFFDDVMGRKSCVKIDQFFIRGRFKNLDIYYQSQSFLIYQRDPLDTVVII